MYYPFHDSASNSLSKNTVDRNFDDLSEKFARKVYGGLKGDIRLAVIWRDLLAVLPKLESKAPQTAMRILDIGGGLGQLTVALAKLGHEVVYNDLSQQMLEAAQKCAEEAGVLDKIIWHQQPYQTLKDEGLGQFDLVMSHALIEWLAEPERLVADLQGYLAPQGLLSLTFYNQNALVYRNLIRGNFNVLQGEFSAHPKSLTPGQPLQPDAVQMWVEQAGLATDYSAGIRVFHDYVTTQRGGHEDSSAVIAMELHHSVQEPFKWLGRYIHFICSKSKLVDTK
jgi:S-adenosylmethionine-dependent methyltransferase